MSALIPFESASVPAHVLAAFGGESNIPQRASIPSLTFRGKVWRINLEGEETPITKETEDGVEPVSTVSVVILNFNRNRSRAYYEGSFEEGKSQAPACWSSDGVAPDKGVSEPCAATCAACPNSVKGSRVTDNGKAVAACSQFQRLVVVPSTQLNFEPLLLRLPQTSLWDKDNAANEAQGWYAWSQFVDFIRARGVTNSATIAVKVKFDSRVAYPKLLFKADRYLDADELNVTRDLWKSAKVLDLINGANFVSAPAETPAIAPAPQPEKAAATRQPTKPKPAPAPVPETSDEDEAGGAWGAAPAPTKPAVDTTPAPAVQGVEVGSKLGAALTSWDDA